MKYFGKILSAGSLLLLGSLNSSAQLSQPVNFPLPPNHVASIVTAAEYYIGTDPGFGKGTSINITSGADVSNNNILISIPNHETGIYRLYVRTRNATNIWSLCNEATFFIMTYGVLFPSNPNKANIISAEYFFDTDPGLGKGLAIPVSRGTDVSVSSFAVPINMLPTGLHRIYICTQNANGQWSITNVASFYILPVSFSIPPNAAPGNITRFEYFFDKDPGFGKGTVVTVSPTTDMNNYTHAADITGLKTDSIHTLYTRTFDDWSMTNTKIFIIGSLLPVTWISFNAKAINNKVLLDWKTAHETNTGHFDVERSSDGVHFSKIGTIEASRNSSIESDYSFTDEQPLNGISYYRLKQVDIDVHYTYSIVISVKLNAQLSVRIIENPIRQSVHLQISGIGQKGLQISLVDALGKRYRVISAVYGSQQINVSNLAAGIYYLVYSLDGKPLSIPFTKQ